FGMLTALEGVEAVPYPLRFDGEWHLDAAALTIPPRARAVLVVSPGNPTGAFLKQAERAALADRCARAGCALVCDEVFADFALLRTRPPDAAWDVLPAEAGWSAVLSVPRSRSEEEWALALLQAGVLVHPGYFFDFPAGAHLVVSLLPAEGEFGRAARILADVL